MPTPNWGLPILTGTEAMSFKGLYNAQSNALETGMDNLSKSSGIPRVANATARNTLFPSPVQGNRVYRNDLGWDEAYYAAYNVTTNPGGATPAGWYPVSGNTPSTILYRAPWTAGVGGATTPIYVTGTTVQKITPTVTLNQTTGVLTFQTLGDYNMFSEAAWAANASGQRNLGWDGTANGLTNNTGNILGPGVAEGQHLVQQAFRITSAGQTVRPFLIQNSGAALTVRTSLTVQYLGPAQ